MRVAVILTVVSLTALKAAGQLTSPTNAPQIASCFAPGGPCNSVINGDLDCLTLSSAPTAIIASCACGVINQYMPSVTPLLSPPPNRSCICVMRTPQQWLTVVYSLCHGFSRCF